MPKRILDTNILINAWRHNCKGKPSLYGVREAAAWGRGLLKLHPDSEILTPIYIEFVAGCRSSDEMALAEAFLGCFARADDGKITSEDWLLATKIAKRVPGNSAPRQLGDCLIRAICQRLHLEVFTADASFPQAVRRQPAIRGHGKA